MKRPGLKQENVLVTICPDDKDKYRFGFNGQEKVNEWSGIGNHNTAEFWEYETRTGRRLNLDPVDKIWESDYASFSNNPIIFIDPNGNTDFFNANGDKIGSDGVDNGVKLIVLKKKTVNDILKQVKEMSYATLNQKQLKNTHLVPSQETLRKYDEIFDNTTNGAAKEFGMVAGIDSKGNQMSSPVAEGGDGNSSGAGLPSFGSYHSAKAFFKGGGKNRYIIHSHPNVIKYLGKNEETGKDDFKTSDENQSAPDRALSHSTQFADVVLEIRPQNFDAPSMEDKKNAKEANGKWILRTDSKSQMVEIYNEDGTLYRGTRSDYEKLIDKINNTPKK